MLIDILLTIFDCEKTWQFLLYCFPLSSKDWKSGASEIACYSINFFAPQRTSRGTNYPVRFFFPWECAAFTCKWLVVQVSCIFSVTRLAGVVKEPTHLSKRVEQGVPGVVVRPYFSVLYFIGWCFNKGSIACLRLSPLDWSVQRVLKVKLT